MIAIPTEKLGLLGRMTFALLSGRQPEREFCGSAHKVESCHRKANGPGYQGSVSSTPCAQKGLNVFLS